MNPIPKWVFVFITYVKHNTSNNVFIFSTSCPTAPKSPVKTEKEAKFQKKNQTKAAYFFSTNSCCKLLLKVSIIDDKAFSLMAGLYPKKETTFIVTNLNYRSNKLTTIIQST